MKGTFITSGMTFGQAIKPSLFGDTSSPTFNTTEADKDIVALESGGNYKAFNPAGGGEGAVGKYQFRWTAHKDKIREFAGNSNLTKEAFMNNPKLQDSFFNDYWKPNVLRPQANDIERKYKTGLPSDKLEKLVHFRGKQGAEEYLNGTLTDKPESYNMSISGYTGIKRQNLGLRKLNMGGVLSAYGTVMQPISQLIEGDDPTNINRAVLAGAMQSGVIGAVTKGLQAHSALKAQNKQDRTSRFLNLPNSQASYQMLGNDVGYYAKGGLLKPEYEAEKGEIAIGNPQLEDGEEIAPGVHKVGGESHENGGTLGSGGEFMFSNEVMLDNNGMGILSYLGITTEENISFSKAAELIGIEKNKFSFESHRYRESNTNKMMSLRFDAGLAQLAQLQEQIKQTV